MILQMHDDKTQGEEQLSPPAENKHMGTPLEKRPEPTPASSRRWNGILLSTLGIVLAFVGGFLIVWPWQYMSESAVQTNSILNAVLLVGFAISVFVGAVLLRSWLALLIVLVACIAGWILAMVLSPLVYGWYCGNIPNITCPASGWYSPGWSALQALSETGVLWRGLSSFLLWGVPLLLFLATCGVFYSGRLSNWLQRRWQQR
jgi:hypothetical protein